MNDSRIESTKEFYNTHVDDYVANIEQAGITHAPTQHADTFHQHLQESDGLKEPFKVLELGCGYGRDAIWFASKGINVIGTDYSRSMLLKAQENAPSIHFLEMDMRELVNIFLPNSLDGIWACASMIHSILSNIHPSVVSVYTRSWCIKHRSGPKRYKKMFRKFFLKLFEPTFEERRGQCLFDDSLGM